MLKQIQGVPWDLICLCLSGLFRMTFVMGGISRGGYWQPHTKVVLKWIKHLSVKLDTIKLLEENLGRILWHKSQQDLLDLSPGVIKTKTNKWDLIKLRVFAQKRKPQVRRKDNTQNGRKYLQMNHHKVLTSKIHKQFMQFNIKTQTTQPKNEQRPRQTFLQRQHTDDQQTHEKMLNITHYERNANWNHSEVSHHTKWSSSKKNLQAINAGENVEKRENFCFVGGNISWNNHYRGIGTSEPYLLFLKKSLIAFCNCTVDKCPKSPWYCTES